MSIRFIFFILFSVSGLTAQTGNLKGIVKDTGEGAPVGNSYIIAHPSSPQGLGDDIRVPVDRDGVFSIDLRPGFYDIFVARAGFAPVCRKIEIRAGKTTAYMPRVTPSKIE